MSEWGKKRWASWVMPPYAHSAVSPPFPIWHLRVNTTREVSPEDEKLPSKPATNLASLSIYLGHSTLAVDLSDSWTSECNLLFSLQAFSTPYVRLLDWICESIFLFFSYLWFLFPFGSRAIRYYISTRTTAAVPTSNSLESEESIPTRYLLYVAYTPRVASTVLLVLVCTCLLRASTMSNCCCCCCCLLSFHLWDLLPLWQQH